MNFKNILGIDMGGTAIKYGVYNTNGESIPDTEGKIEANRNWSFEEIVNTVEDLKNQCSKSVSIDGIGLSVPGVVDKHTGMITFGGALEKGLHKKDLRQAVEEKLNIPTSIENDANCAALAEFWLGSGKGCENIVVITVGTGLGGGMILNKKLHQGSHSFASEFGLLFYQPTNSEADDWAYVSTSRLIKRAAQVDSTIENGKDFFAALDINSKVKEVYQDWIEKMARGIYTVATVVDPDKVLLGGGISKQQRIYSDIKNELDKITSFPYYFTVESCHFFNDAGKIGAVYNWIASR